MKAIKYKYNAGDTVYIRKDAIHIMDEIEDDDHDYFGWTDHTHSMSQIIARNHDKKRRVL